MTHHRTRQSIQGGYHPAYSYPSRMRCAPSPPPQAPYISLSIVQEEVIKNNEITCILRLLDKFVPEETVTPAVAMDTQVEIADLEVKKIELDEKIHIPANKRSRRRVKSKS